MPVYEKVKSLVCNPTHKCCEILCSYCKTSPRNASDETDDTHHSKMKSLLEKIESAKPHKKKARDVRRHTGWDPKAQNVPIDEDEDDDDEDIGDIDPIQSKWRNKKSLVFPLTITSTGTDIEQTDCDDPVKSKWANKHAAVYSAVTVLDVKPSRYWVQSNLQYVVVLPAERPHRSLSPRPSPPPAPPPTVEEEPPEEEFPEEGKAREEEEFPEEEKVPETVEEDFIDKIKREDEDDQDESESEDSFVPRSDARPSAPKTKRFCCAKQQNSE